MPDLFTPEVPAAITAAGPRPRILGLDLSITAPGIACPNGETVTITAKQPGDWRLMEIEAFIHTIVAEGVDLAVIEDLPTHARAAGITGMVHGAIRLLLMTENVPYATVTPATLKSYATGKGNADKTAMAMAAYKRSGREFGDDNQCDAFWLRAAGLDWYGQPEFDLPKIQRERLVKVQWPEAVTR
ncbi:Holliday junction endonuclease [Streptomyces phaeochromogenes]|uniref:Holliday junction endonuclease n=1 Tax=Streptomyces phaeochromogenes TaxID=1923 RepID=UPI00386FDF35|nr:Holliday junction endonuclease [Streptomyces phaeochromogenes]